MPTEIRRLHARLPAGSSSSWRVLLRSRFGRALAGIRVNEQRMRATGFSTYPYKLAALHALGGIAGLAGFLFAVKDGSSTRSC